MPPSSKTSFFHSSTVRLLGINLVTILVFGLAFFIVISTFGRISDIFKYDVHYNMHRTIASFNFGKKLLILEMGIHNQEAGFLHDPEGTIIKRDEILADFDEIIDEIKMSENYFRHGDEFDRLLAYRHSIDVRLSDNVKISKIALEIELLSLNFLDILSAMEADVGAIIVQQVLAGLQPTGLQQITALIPLCREQILTARYLVNRGVDDLNADLLDAGANSEAPVTMIDAVDLLFQTLQTMTSASPVIADKANKIISYGREYRQLALDLGQLVRAKKKHHAKLEDEGYALIKSLNRADQQMIYALEQVTDKSSGAMDKATKILYLIALVVLLVVLTATFMIVLHGRKMAQNIVRKEMVQADLLVKMAELEEEVVKRREAEDSVRELAENLEKSVRTRTVELSAVNMELEALIYSMSHDLRTPLRGIAGFSNAMLEDCDATLDGSGRHYLARIQDASISMGKTIDQILELSRFSRANLSKEELDMSGMVETTIRELQRNDPGRSIRVEIAPNLLAYGAAEQVRAVLESLLANAWKFTGQEAEAVIEFGTVQRDDKAELSSSPAQTKLMPLRYKAELSSSPAQTKLMPLRYKLLFYVKDNGVGFNEAYSAKMFGAFQRLHAAEEFPGAGLGLALAQRVIQRHGGKIWGEGKEGSGATFYFHL